VKILLTGSAGFIGSEIARQLTGAGHEVVGVDLMLAMAHGDSEPPHGTHQLDVRDSVDSADATRWAQLLHGVDAVCHQAAVVGAGVTVADLPAYAAHNDLGTAALLAAMHEGDVHRLVLASSMVVYGEGRYECPTHGEQSPAARTRQALDAGDFDNHCPRCDAPLRWELVEETARMDPRSTYAVSKLAQEHYSAAWVRQADASAVALRYHNVYGPGMPRDTPYSGVAAMFRSSLERGEAPQVYEDGAQMRDFVHVSDIARANVLALQAVVDAPEGMFETYNVCSGRPVAIADVARQVAIGAGPAVEPQITGGYRLGDVRHIVASPHKADRELGFTAQVAPADGLAEFATAPLRA
jgi:dTDP-L-rhamnose 4-epimerase